MSNILTNQIRTSPGPSEIEKELIKRMEGQNFQNASGMIPRDNHRLNSENVIQTGPKIWTGPDLFFRFMARIFGLVRATKMKTIKITKKDNCQNLQQKLIDQKRAEIDRRNKFEEQSRKKKIQVSFGLQVK